MLRVRYFVSLLSTKSAATVVEAHLSNASQYFLVFLIFGRSFYNEGFFNVPTFLI